MPRAALPKWRINFGEAGSNVRGRLGFLFVVCPIAPERWATRKLFHRCPTIWSCGFLNCSIVPEKSA